MEDFTKYATPFKLGRPVLSGSGKEGEFDSMAVDCPFIFYHQEKFHLLYVGFDGNGYQTALAVSSDLINWQKKGVVLSRNDSGTWDKIGAAGTWIIRHDDINGLPTLKKIDGKYWMIYHSYPEKGYETGPAQMGLAWCEDENLLDWRRLKEPVFSWKGGADWENGGLYKGCIIEYDGTYYLFYNAKNKPGGKKQGGVGHENWVEQTGIATSTDLFEWKRHEGNPVIKVRPGTWESRFCSDPCVMRDGDRWVMFYFGFDGKHAQDGIAVSNDLIRWEKKPEPIIRHGNQGDLDEKHAHKPSVILFGGVLYHFFCACRDYRDGDSALNLGNEFRCLTVATSKPLPA